MESRLQTPFKDEAASVHSCDDEGKEDDGRDDMHRARNCDGAASRIAEALSLADQAGAILPSNCRGGRSSRMYF